MVAADSEESACEWEKYVDDATEDAYYYNTRTGETSWEAPDRYVEKETGGDTSDHTENSGREDSTPAKPPRWRRFTDKSSGKSYFYDEANDVTTWEEPEGDVEDASNSDDENEGDEEIKVEDEGDENSVDAEVTESERLPDNSIVSERLDGGSAGEPAATEETKPSCNWVKHIDKATGKPYFHDTISNTTQWETPRNYTEASQASTISAEYLEYLKRSQAERLVRVTQQALDPDGNLSKLNALLSKIDGPNLAAGDSVDAPEEIEQSLKERARAEWQQHVDPHTQRYYYHNIVTGETQWQKPEAPIVSALADWIPPETPDTDAQATPKRMVSGQHYAATAKFNRVSGKFEKLGGDEYWQAQGVAADREGRQMSHFFDTKQLDKNREDAKRIKEELKRKNIDWKKVAAEKKAKKQKRKNEWIYQD